MGQFGLYTLYGNAIRILGIPCCSIIYNAAREFADIYFDIKDTADLY